MAQYVHFINPPSMANNLDVGDLPCTTARRTRGAVRRHVFTDTGVLSLPLLRRMLLPYLLPQLLLCLPVLR